MIHIPFTGQTMDNPKPTPYPDPAPDPKNRRETPPRPVTPEMLVPRLGDYLQEMGIVRPDQLQHALDLQQAYLLAEQPRMLGQVLVELGYVSRDVLDRVITEQILALQTALRSSNEKLEDHVQARTGALEWRLFQIRAAAEVAQKAVSATRQEDLLAETTSMIAERFGYSHVKLYLLDVEHQVAILRATAGQNNTQITPNEQPVPPGRTCSVGYVIAQAAQHVAGDVSSDPLAYEDKLLPGTRSIACLPMISGDELVGALHVQSDRRDAFNNDDIAVLQTLANQIAASVRSVGLLELTQRSLQEISLMFGASHRIARAESTSEVLRLLRETLTQTGYTFALLTPAIAGMRIFALFDPDDTDISAEYEKKVIQISVKNLEDRLADAHSYIRLDDFGKNQLAALDELAKARKISDGVVFLIWSGEIPAAACFLGSKTADRFTRRVVQPYLTLAEFCGTALARLSSLETSVEQVKRLQILNDLGQIIARETELDSLFATVHRQITNLYGDCGFYIALYDEKQDRISFPYLYDDGQMVHIDPIPLGEGLTSIVIRGREPLLLVEDTEQQARALGARSVGKFAKSWLGIPLKVGEEVLGVLTVQDVEREHAFTDEDAHLLTTISTQVSVAIRNAELIASIRRQADGQRRLYEISDKIRRATSMDEILATTTEELGRALNAHKAHIQIRIGDSRHDIKPGNGSGGAE